MTRDKMQEKYDQIPKEDKEEIALMVIDRAISLFNDCGQIDDFCVQAIGFNCVIFGGVNRVIWGLNVGFWADASYCTEDFIDKFNLALKNM
jgi:hypothetical protein